MAQLRSPMPPTASAAHPSENLAERVRTLSSALQAAREESGRLKTLLKARPPRAGPPHDVSPIAGG